MTRPNILSRASLVAIAALGIAACSTTSAAPFLNAGLKSVQAGGQSDEKCKLAATDKAAQTAPASPQSGAKTAYGKQKPPRLKSSPPLGKAVQPAPDC